MGNKIGDIWYKLLATNCTKKKKVLVDILVEMQSYNLAECKVSDEEKEMWWVLHTDGSTNVQGVGIGIVLQSTNGLVLEEGIILGFEVT